MKFGEYLKELQKVPKEEALEPELKQNRQEHDKKLREEQAIESGAVLEAILAKGDGDALPVEGDLLYVHVTIKSLEEDVLFTTRSDEGGNGQPLAFVLEKGLRAPRSWEIALKGTKKGGRKALQVQPGFGYQHPDCTMPAPAGVPVDQSLVFDLELVNWYSEAAVLLCGDDDSIFKRILVEGGSWETPRPPFEVTFHCSARTIAYDGIQQSGFQYFTTTPEQPLQATMGAGSLPEGVEACVAALCKGEKSVFVVPATAATASGQAAALVPAPPQRATQVELEIELLSFVQVRDMTGTGEVLKRRVREGEGEFPMDCPLQDAAMKLRVRARAHGRPCGWEVVKPPGSTGGAGSGGEEAEEVGRAPVIDVDTGCGELPEGVEMAAKLMLPGELATVVCAPQFAYRGRDDAPVGIRQEETVEFEIQLESFQKEGHWQVMPLAERLQLAERMKARGNELYKQGRTKYAKARYERLYKLLDSIRDYETDAEEAEGLRLRVACCNNMAICCFGLQEYSEAVVWCNKGLGLDEKNAKLLVRKGRALTMKGDYEEAEAELKLALEGDPGLADEVDSALLNNRQRAKAAVQRQKQQFRNFFDR